MAKYSNKGKKIGFITAWSGQGGYASTGEMIASVGTSYIPGSFIHLKPEERKRKISELTFLRVSLNRLRYSRLDYRLTPEYSRIEAEIDQMLD